MIDVAHDFPLEINDLDKSKNRKVTAATGWFLNPAVPDDDKYTELGKARNALDRPDVNLDVILAVTRTVADRTKQEAVRTAATELFVQTWARYPGVTPKQVVGVLKDLDTRLTPGRRSRGATQEFFPDQELGILARLAAATTKGRWAGVPAVRGHALGLVQTLAARDERLIPQLMAPVFEGLFDPDSRVYLPAQSALRVLLQKGSDSIFKSTLAYMSQSLPEPEPQGRRAAQLAVAACLEAKKQPLLQFLPVIEQGLGDACEQVSAEARVSLALLLLDSPNAQQSVERWILERAAKEEHPPQRVVQQALGAWTDAGLPGSWSLYHMAHDKISSPFNDVAALARDNFERLRPQQVGPKGPQPR